MIDYCLEDTCCKPTIKITDTGKMTMVEKVCYLIEVTGEVVVLVNGYEERILKNEADIVTLFNELESTNSNVENVEVKTDSNSDQLLYLTNQFADGRTGFVIDGGFFEETGINANYDGGIF